MADTTNLNRLENWVRSALAERFGSGFEPKKVSLKSGGLFEFDAVSEDELICACISTSAAKTAGGKPNSGAIHKIRADAFFLGMANTRRRLLVFTEEAMHERFLNDQAKLKRLPLEFECVLVKLPPEMQQIVESTRSKASRESYGHE